MIREFEDKHTILKADHIIQKMNFITRNNFD